ncbi:DMT family transporter [Herbiconiux moechotypicola]|uniref:DMT family transporter n=1 Tax=Herbiconiux moechotypicola TaxID=637393 RepID=A0ABN3DLS8_9MICO|nr:DMT family transporter [Herbiconiux moechotypicola]MCS5730193.1 DMT family transporter [Herbiconiux moechotypicola]
MTVLPPAHPPHVTSASARLPLWAGIVIAVGCGVLMATQSRVNGEFGRRIDDGFTAAAISFVVGLAIVSVIVAIMPTARHGARTALRAVRAGGLPAWMLFAGFGGAIFVLSQGLASALVGVSLFTVAFIGGQTVSGLVVDRIGIGPGGRRYLTPRRVLGALIAFGTVVWSVSSHLDPGIPLWLLLLPVIAGVAQAVQQAANGRVAAAAGSAVSSTFFNFIAGSAALVVVALVHAGVTGGFPASLPSLTGEWWLYLGGPLGVAFIFGLATAVRVTGVLLLGLCSITGQLLGSIAIDLVAPGSGHTVDWTTPIAAALVVIAVLVVSLPARRRR